MPGPLKVFHRISIHAPARGATLVSCLWLFRLLYFYPRSRKGSDVVPVFPEFNAVIFLSTLPQGERLSAYLVIIYLTNISIHAPARGATRWPLPASPPQNRISIHAPARGATLFFVAPLMAFMIFLSTLPQGERHPENYLDYVYKDISIHAPARGATPSLCGLI